MEFISRDASKYEVKMCALCIVSGFISPVILLLTVPAPPLDAYLFHLFVSGISMLPITFKICNENQLYRITTKCYCGIDTGGVV